MSRGPLEVLRMVPDTILTISPEGRAWRAEVEEAIAQVEALVSGLHEKAEKWGRLAKAGRTTEFGEGTRMAYASCSEIVLDLLESFTPGQDSEGGGNG